MLNLKIASRLGIAQKSIKMLRWLSRLIRKSQIYYRNQSKVFVIGMNKTGTTTLFYAIEELGYIMSNQHHFERMYNRFVKGEIKIDQILADCSDYEVFQDIPFSLPEFYKYAHKKYPKARFILTVRSSSDMWFRSFKNYYGDKEKLMKDDYLESGFLYNTFKNVFDSDDLLKENCVEVYEKHNEDVKEYFKHNHQQLLVLDVSKENSYNELCQFLKKTPRREVFQWENKTDSKRAN